MTRLPDPYLKIPDPLVAATTLRICAWVLSASALVQAPAFKAPACAGLPPFEKNPSAAGVPGSGMLGKDASTVRLDGS